MANNQLLASDNFASGSLAAGWAAIHGLSECQITGSPYVAEANAIATEAGQVWTALGALGDQCSEVTTSAFTSESGTALRLYVRCQSGSQSGYYASFTNGGYTINRIDNGVTTGLVSGSAGSVTAIYTLQIAGSVLTLLENGQPLNYVCDTTYATGYPGFSIIAATLAHLKVGSWRGFSIQQQDGIWTKQKIAIPVLAADTNKAGVNTCTVLHEGNAQILSGTVFKMWFGSGWSSPAGVYYAESADGLNWTINGSASIADKLEPIVFKYAGTYYLYCQSDASQAGTIFAYTSPDGVAWTLQNSTALQVGAGGSWDASGIYALTPIAVVGGTWYACYSGENASGIWSTGLAISSDGLTWSKYASNPTLVGYFTAGARAYLNGVAYLWAAAAPVIAGQPHSTDPTQSVRFQSTDFINWTNPVHSVDTSEPFESLNEVTGQGCAGSLLTVGSTTYLYTQASSPLDSGNGSFYQILVATVPATLAQIVTANEDAAQQVATDAFQRADGSLGANWTTPSGLTALQISSDLVEASALASVCQQFYNAAVFGDNQYSEVTIHALVSGSYMAPCVRMQANGNCYNVSFTGNLGSPSDIKVQKYIGEISSPIGLALVITPQAGDKLRLTVVTAPDGLPYLSIYQNGFLIMQYPDTTNAIPSGGAPGIQLYAVTSLAHAQVSGWAGGNANVIPPYPSGTNWYPVDCRDYSSFPLTPVIVQGSGIYALDPNSDNSKLPPTDSRKVKPTDDRVSTIIPENSRNNPNPNA